MIAPEAKKLVTVLRIELTPGYRRAIAKRLGKPGLATRRVIVEWAAELLANALDEFAETGE
jgi:hypothetical protein